jgi:hypothetical protein
LSEYIEKRVSNFIKKHPEKARIILKKYSSIIKNLIKYHRKVIGVYEQDISVEKIYNRTVYKNDRERELFDLIQKRHEGTYYSDKSAAEAKIYSDTIENDLYEIYENIIVPLKK